MNCPVCKIPMIVVEKNGIELDHCVDCNGTWFDRDEVDSLLRALDFHIDALHKIPATSEAVEGEKPRPCPLCRKPMEKLLIGESDPVLIDRCKRHGGYWFDANELTRIIRQSVSSDGWRNVSDFLGGMLGSFAENKQQD